MAQAADLKVKLDLEDVKRIKLEPGEVLHIHLPDGIPLGGTLGPLKEMFGYGKCLVTQGDVTVRVIDTTAGGIEPPGELIR